MVTDMMLYSTEVQ